MTYNKKMDLYNGLHKRWRWSHFLNKILIVDQNEFDCMEMTYTLKREGYTHIFSASNLNDALCQIKEHNPDLILCNVDLPDGDGFALCEQVSGLVGVQSKVVLLTDHVQNIDLARSRKCGAADFLVKTKYFESLPQTIHDLMTR